MIEKGIVTAWILGGLVLFLCWDSLPRRARQEYEKADKIQNPIARQGCLFAVLVKCMCILVLVGIAFFAAWGVALKLGLFDNTPIHFGH